MKIRTALCLFLITIFNAHAQDNEIYSYSPTATIEDLKGFIGLNVTGIQKEMKKRGFSNYNAEEDEYVEPFSYQYFYDEEDEEMMLMIDENKVVGAGYEGFSNSNYSNILNYFKVFDWVKTLHEKMIVNAGLERVDIWVSEDKKWKVRVDYLKGVGGMKNTITRITLTTNVVGYDFE